MKKTVVNVRVEVSFKQDQISVLMKNVQMVNTLTLKSKSAQIVILISVVNVSKNLQNAYNVQLIKSLTKMDFVSHVMILKDSQYLLKDSMRTILELALKYVVMA